MSDFEAWKDEYISSNKAKGLSGYCWSYLNDGFCAMEEMGARCTYKHTYPPNWTANQRQSHQAMQQASYEADMLSEYVCDNCGQIKGQECDCRHCCSCGTHKSEEEYGYCEDCDKCGERCDCRKCGDCGERETLFCDKCDNCEECCKCSDDEAEREEGQQTEAARGAGGGAGAVTAGQSEQAVAVPAAQRSDVANEAAAAAGRGLAERGLNVAGVGAEPAEAAGAVSTGAAPAVGDADKITIKIKIKRVASASSLPTAAADCNKSARLAGA